MPVQPPVRRESRARELEFTGALGSTVERTDPIPVGPDEALSPGTRLTGQLRLRGIAKATWYVGIPLIAKADLESYMYSGQLLGEADLTGVDLPADQDRALHFKEAFATLSIGPFLTVGGGLTSGTWGMGLLANGGRNGWTPGSARFSDPYLGDTNARLLVATGPWTPLKITAFGFSDAVVEEDALRPGDEANQFGGGIRVGDEMAPGGGLYVVRRRQEAGDGAYLEATAFDLAGRIPLKLGGGMTLRLETEMAYIVGETTLAPSFDHRKHDIRQWGGAFRATFSAGSWGAVVDLLYASGDRNIADGEQNAFKVDRNYEMGLILFRQLMAAQSGYAPTTASNPLLVGRPAEDLDRFPTRGGASNTVALFPRGFWRPASWIEIFGGPLLAFAEVEPVDPLNTNFAGGEPRNAMDAAPGGYLGTELAIGIRGHLNADPIRITGGLEGAALLPGSAYDDADGQAADSLLGGRATLEVAF